jgi:hypothetical protein
MQVDAPTIANLNAGDARAHRLFTEGLGTLSKAIAARKIWNVEFNDLKSNLGYCVDHAMSKLSGQLRDAKPKSNPWEEYWNDVSGWCGFNQASGRIKRLTKVFGITPKNELMGTYLAALAEVAAMNVAIKSLKPFIVKGRRPNENKTEEKIAEELSNTGVCAICAHRQKLDDDGKMVHHGYQMSDYNHSGYRIGSCFGVGYLCYELGDEANLAFAPILQGHLKAYKAALKILKSGTVMTLTVERSKYEGGHSVKYNAALEKGTPEFDRKLAGQISQTETFIRYTKSDIKINDAKIADWTLHPLKYGRKP